MKDKGRLILILGIVTIFVVLFSQCMDSGEQLKATETTTAGMKTCRQCHQKIYDEYQHEWHNITSKAVTGDSLIRGGNSTTNEYVFNPHLRISVEKRKDGMYQIAYGDGREILSRRFDVSIGSGKNAHTYGFWDGEKLIQLPLTYFRSINEWTNSPGYPNRIYFQGIGIRCLECHTSYADGTKGYNNGLMVDDKIQKNSIIYGIDCERCHGPAGRHVEFHLKNPAEKAAKYIAVYKELTRQQKLDACGLCHSGNDLDVVKSAFLFKPGDTISNYYDYHASSFSSHEPDVHGNQLGMLQTSQCFIKSNDMTCGTCHSPHKPEEDNLIAYSKKCMSCHSAVNHSEKTLANAMVKTNCITCHMPLKPSKIITYQQAGQPRKSAYELHTHRIAVY